MILASWIQFIVFLVGIGTILVFTVPNNVRMGTYFFDSFQYEKAFEYYAGALKNDGSDLQNLKRLKEYYLVMGETKRALELQESLVKLKPQNLSYHQELVSLYDWNQMPVEKLRAMEAEAKLMKGKKRLERLYEVAEGYRWLRLYEKANPIYEELAQTGEEEYLEAALSFYAATGQREKVETLGPRVRPSSDPDIYLRWMAELAEADGKIELALEKYRNILSTSQREFHEDLLPEFNPSWIKPRLGIIERINRLLLRLDRMEESIELQRKLGELFPENLALTYDLGYFHLERGHTSRALDVFRRLQEREKNPERLFEVCNVFVALKSEGEANLCLKSLVGSHPINSRFLEGLAESHERLGNKREALRLYEKILYLQGERDASLWRAQDLIFLAQAGPFDGGLMKKKTPEINTERMSEKKLDELRQKVIYLREELGDGKRSEKLMLALVRRHPKNKSYLKQLGFHYLDNNDRERGVAVMERVLVLDPKDPEALRVVLGMDAEKGRSEEVYRKLKLLEPLKDNSLIELKFYVLVDTGRRDELSEFCLQEAIGHAELRFRCEYELGDKKLATQELKSFIEANKRNDLRPLLATWYVGLGDEKATARELKWMEENGKVVSLELKNALADLRAQRAARWEWLLKGKATQVVQTDSQYLLSEFDLLKKLDGPGIGVLLDSLHGTNPFSLVSPYLYYGWKEGEIKAGPSLNLSDRELGSPFFVDASYFGNSKLFFNLHFENARPEYALRDLQRSDRAHRSYFSAYTSYRLPGHFIEASLDRNDYEFEDEAGSDIQLYAEYLKTEVFHRRWAFGVRGFMAKLDTDGERLRALHIEEALGYYAVAQYANSFLVNRFNHWNFQAKFALGGDAQRKIPFGEALNARLQMEYFKTEKKGLRFYGEYFKESYLARINDLSLFGVQFLINF